MGLLTVGSTEGESPLEQPPRISKRLTTNYRRQRIDRPQVPHKADAGEVERGVHMPVHRGVGALPGSHAHSMRPHACDVRVRRISPPVRTCDEWRVRG